MHTPIGTPPTPTIFSGLSCSEVLEPAAGTEGTREEGVRSCLSPWGGGLQRHQAQEPLCCAVDRGSKLGLSQAVGEGGGDEEDRVCSPRKGVRRDAVMG